MVKKRSATIAASDADPTQTIESLKKTKKQAQEEKRAMEEEMGEFEDMYEDEIEEEDVILGEDDEDAQVEAEAEEDEEPAVRAYLPGQSLQEGEVLDYDSSAYDMYHAMNMEWPCLTFDIVRDRLGDNRTSFPMTAYFVAGTQADRPENNKLMVMKASRLHRTKHDSDSESSDCDDMDDDPILQSKSIPHTGTVNRLRLMPHATLQIAATFADTSHVHIHDLTSTVQSLDTPTPTPIAPTQTLLHSIQHPSEGYALAWHPRLPGQLLSGDCTSHLRLTIKHEGGAWSTVSEFQGHTASVEDTAWSPTQDHVFASCSVDTSVKVWDTRLPSAGLSFRAADTDVNVLSWNERVPYLMASGDDAGGFAVWDLRKTSSPAAAFKWHRAAVTSVEWCPWDESVLGVMAADDVLSIWDFSVEQDSEEAAEPELDGVPPQLLFIHQGQRDMKELHWHRQMPGVLMSTAGSGFNIFKTISV